MLDVIFADTLAAAVAWEQQARDRRRISRVDPVADTLDHCAADLRATIASIEGAVESEVEFRLKMNTLNRMYAEVEECQRQREYRYAGGVVYFLRNRENGLIKIGSTTDLTRRIKTLAEQGGLDIHLLGTMNGGRPMEMDLHRRFHDLRVRGEWFRPERRLVKWIAAWADKPSRWDDAQ